MCIMVVKTTVSVALAAVALFAPLASSHIIMSLPQPYNFKTDPFVQKDPLDGVSFKFPCQGRGHTVDSNITTVVAGGAPMPVTFTGTAAHGGGSCQFSVSYDDPQAAGGWNASSKFKTIYTLIGGCPASSVGNLKDSSTGALDNTDGPHCGNDSGKECIREFLIPFPKFLKNGPAVFSWTWHNRVGNREIYQNCAPIMITGGTEDESEIEALPEIFLGNLPAVQTDIPGYKPCHLGQGQTVNYPNPGKYGRVLEPPTDPEAMPSDYCSDVPLASVLPKFVGDDSGAGAFPTMTPVSNLTNPAPIGSVFLTLPTDGGIPAGDYGPHPTTKESPLPTESTSISYGHTVTSTSYGHTVTSTSYPHTVTSTSYGHTVTVTLLSNTTVTVCPAPGPMTAQSSAFPTLEPYPGYGYSFSGYTGSGPDTARQVQETTYTVVETTRAPSITITLRPVDSAPVDPSWLRPCGSTTPSETDLTACWH